MTQADSAPALRMSLTSANPIGAQEQAASANTPLPTGWGSFCSKPDQKRNEPGRWYATAPWHVETLTARLGAGATRGMLQTVHAESWQRLCIEVAAQEDFYGMLGLRR